jgi:hypothetical protein
MSYVLYGLIGKRQTLEAVALPSPTARIVPLEQNIAIIPLTDELCEDIGASCEIENFYKLSPELEEWALRISKAGLVAYIEAEFFGGSGNQSALCWNGVSRMLGPVHEQKAINRVLKLLGVNKGNSHDEFDAVGLGKHRDTHHWK